MKNNTAKVVVRNDSMIRSGRGEVTSCPENVCPCRASVHLRDMVALIFKYVVQ